MEQSNMVRDVCVEDMLNQEFTAWMVGDESFDVKDWISKDYPWFLVFLIHELLVGEFLGGKMRWIWMDLL